MDTFLTVVMAVLLMKLFDAVAYNVAKYVEAHVDYATGNVRVKRSVVDALWWLA